MTLVLPLLRRQGAHSMEHVETDMAYDIGAAFPDVVFADSKAYFARFGEAVDANVFFMYDNEGLVEKGECPAESTDGGAPRFKMGYSNFKPQSAVQGDGDNECMLANKKAKLGRHRCVNAVAAVADGGLDVNEACGASFLALVEAELDGLRGSGSLLLTGFHNIQDCRSSDETRHPPRALPREASPEGALGYDYEFAPAIRDEADKFARKEFGGEGAGGFVALHLKRGEGYREKWEELWFTEDEVVRAMLELAQRHGTFSFLVATQEKSDVMYLRKKLERAVTDEDAGYCYSDGSCPAIKVVSYSRRPSTGFKGLQVGLVEQALAVRAKAFVGAKHSAFTRDIHGRRQALGKHGGDAVLDKGCALLEWAKYQ